jgi:hypothetical protein
MRQDHRDIRCAVCTTTEGPFECHHIALRANHDTAAVAVCRGACHDEQTDRQRRAGLIGRCNKSADDLTLALLHAITEGLAGIFDANARHTGNVELAHYIDRDRRVTLRLLALVSDERPGALGPRPITNDRRSRHRQARNTSAPMPNVADSLPALAGIFPALITAISTPPRPGTAALLPGSTELLRGFTVDDAARLFTPAGADKLARRLAALEDHPRIKELAAIIERTSTVGFELTDQLANATAAEALGEEEIDTDRPVQLGRAFYEQARSNFDFALSLVSGADPAEALERFLDRADEPDGGDRGPTT